MRITYRNKDIKDYWKMRWSDIPIDDPMENKNVYPLKYAELTIQSKEGKILEAGCGTGRLLRYYKNKGYQIVGIDIVKDTIDRLKKVDPDLNVEVGDIVSLRFADNFFRYVLAFGLYHNFENNLDRAIKETFRVLESGGKLCASFRADNIQTRLTDWLIAKHTKRKVNNSSDKRFHKLNLTHREFVELFERAGFKLEKVFLVENMSFLYRISFFRSKRHKIFNEHLSRKEGYKLSSLGNMLQRFLIKFFPGAFCNLFVVIARK